MALQELQGAGVIRIPFAQGAAGTPYQPALQGYAIDVLTSRDGGLTFTESTVTATSSDVANIFPVLAVDAAGAPSVAWSQRGPGGSEVLFSSSPDGGATWSAPQALSPPSGNAVLPWLAGGAAGEMVAAWYQTTDTSPSEAVAGDWHVQIALTRDGGATFTQQAVGGTMHRGAICTWGITCQSPPRCALTAITCEGGRALSDFFEVKLDAQDRAHLVYTDDFGHDPLVVYTHSLAPIT